MLTGKTALVAGASRGIGLAIARALSEAGANTIVASRSLEKLQPIANELRGTALELDLTSADSVRRCAEQAGPVDILVNVAGIHKPGDYRGIAPGLDKAFVNASGGIGIVTAKSDSTATADCGIDRV